MLIGASLLPFRDVAVVRILGNNDHSKRWDGWSLHLSSRIYQPCIGMPNQQKSLICRSSSSPAPLQAINLIKVTSVALTRSCKTLFASPATQQLVPAFGIIAFSVWGLLPLMRSIRRFIHSDANWKKSRTYYVTASYLKPFLLWAGSSLICRALDPVVLPSEASQAIKLRLLNFTRSLATVVAFAYSLSSLIQQAQKFFMDSNDSSETRNMGFQFAGKAVYTAVWIAAFALFMELLGFSTQKWVTAGGLGTVLLTLAGREIFTNFLSSVMIHVTRPFILNEWIQTKIEGYEVSGTVEHVGWWSPTIIRAEDREAVHIPNHKFTVSVVRNLTQKTHWRIKTHLAISHLDVGKINNIVADMRKVLAKNPMIEQQRLHRRIFLDNIDPENQALRILVSCFVKTSHFEEYLCVKEAVFLDLLKVISHHRARLATPIRTVQKIYGDASMENIPYAETIYKRTPSRPYILVDPSQRINGDSKVKPRNGTTEEQTSKSMPVDSKNTSDSVDLNSSEKQSQRKANTSDELPKVGKNSATTTASTPNSPVESSETAKSVLKDADKKSVLSEATGGNPDEHVSPASVKNEADKTIPSLASRPVFEDNIVLGVALEGSKRTLPIEEGLSGGPAQSDASEMDKAGGACSHKDKLSAAPGQPKVDQKDP